MYDTSVKVPAIVSHPGTIPAGVVSDALLSQYDWLPPCSSTSAWRIPRVPAAGTLLAPLLRGQDGRGGQDYVVAQHVFDEYGPVRMVRTREWKYVHRYAYGPHELYDLRNDPQEHTNRADDPDQGAVRRELKAELDGWFVRYADPQRDGTREAVYGKGSSTSPAPRGAAHRRTPQTSRRLSRAAPASPPPWARDDRPSRRIVTPARQPALSTRTRPLQRGGRSRERDARKGRDR